MISYNITGNGKCESSRKTEKIIKMVHGEIKAINLFIVLKTIIMGNQQRNFFVIKKDAQRLPFEVPYNIRNIV